MGAFQISRDRTCAVSPAGPCATAAQRRSRSLRIMIMRVHGGRARQSAPRFAADAALLARCRFEDDLPRRDPRLTPAPDDHRTPEMVRLVDCIDSREKMACKLRLRPQACWRCCGSSASSRKNDSTSCLMVTKKAHASSPRLSRPCLHGNLKRLKGHPVRRRAVLC
jgi:hypothetical protein